MFILLLPIGFVIIFSYKDLVARNRLVESKIGNRYFVPLSDKESKKREKSEKHQGERPGP